jgi:regulator of sigma E protease
LWQRAAVIAAGPIANFILAIVVISSIYMTWGAQIIPARIAQIVEGGAADKAGLKPGDLIVAVDGSTIISFVDLQRIVSSSADRQLELSVDRKGSVVTVKLTPERKEVDDGFGGKMRQGRLGVVASTTPADVSYRKYGLFEAVGASVRDGYNFIGSNLSYLREVFAGREKADQLGGPVRIADASGKVCSAGIIPCIHLAAMISVSVGLFNLFPIPPLDGGHLLFYAAEAVRRRPLSETAQGVGFRIGLAFILMLAVFAMWNDLGIVRRWIGG